MTNASDRAAAYESVETRISCGPHPPLARATSGTGERSLLSIVFGQAQLMNTLWWAWAVSLKLGRLQNFHLHRRAAL
jgi:hypothetical protein